MKPPDADGRGITIDLLEGRHLRPPARSRVLHVASVGALVALCALVVAGVVEWSATAASFEAGSAIIQRVPIVVGEREQGPEPVSISGLLDEVERAVVSSGGHLTEFRFTDHRTVGPDLQIRSELPSAGAERLERLLRQLASVGIAESRVRTVLPAPNGVRVDVSGKVEVSLAPRIAPAGTLPEVSIGLAGMASTADVDIRLLEVPGSDRDGVARMVVAGRAPDLVRLIERLEDSYTAPSRIRTVRVERLAFDEQYLLSLTFALRESPMNTPVPGAPR